MEARWFYSGYTPTLDEYLQNAWISVGGPGGMAHAYLLLGSPITKTCLDGIQASSEPVYWSSLIARLCDDLGTSKVIQSSNASNKFLVNSSEVVYMIWFSWALAFFNVSLFSSSPLRVLIYTQPQLLKDYLKMQI